jgi:AcrR family transcriptional regulator
MTREEHASGRPRRPETDQAIVRAAIELIREAGPGAVNVAAIASRTGLARTTIYRRYRDRRALLREALGQVATRDEPPHDLPTADKLLWVLSRAEEVLADGIGMGGVASVLADTDPEFSAALRAALDDALDPVRRQVERDRNQGVIADHVDADALVTVLLGAYLAESLLRGEPSSDEWRQRVVALLRPLTPREPIRP